MGKTKEEVFLPKEIRIAKYCKALAHPARILILRLLISKTNCSFNEILGRIDLVQSTVSQHLSQLKNAGLIKDNKNRKGNYLINKNAVKVAKAYLDRLLELQ